MLTPGAVQTTYNQYLTAAQNGMPATMTGWDADTRIAEDLSSPKVGIGFGLAVSQGTLHGDRSAVLGNASGALFVGITMADPTLPNIDTTFTDKYQDTDNMAVLVRGDIWVVVENNVAPGDEVYYNTTTGQLGATSGGHTAIPSARWMTTATTGNLAVVRLGQSAGNTP